MDKLRGYQLSDVLFSNHAQKQMARRKVTENDVYETLKNPSITLPIFDDNTQEFRRKSGRRTHFVVVDYSKVDLLTIVTTGWSGEP